MQENLTTVAIVRHRYESLAVLQNGFAIILLWASEDVEKLFETVYKYDKEKKQRNGDESSICDLKMPKQAQILEQSSGTRPVWMCIGLYSFLIIA